MEAPEHLASEGQIAFGRFDARPTSADPLAGAGAPARWWRRTRLKEWLGFFLLHPEWSTSFIVQDAKYLASSDFLAYDRRTDRFQRRQAVGPPGSLRLPADLLTGSVQFSRKGYDVSFGFGGPSGEHRLELDIAASKDFAPVRGTLTLHTAGGSAPLSVSSKLPRGSLYTWKQVFGVSGTLQVGDARITFEPERDLAIVDEHRSLLPYRTDWTWGTFALREAGVVVGANFATRPQVADQEEESGLWFDNRCEPLADIAFAPTSDDPLAAWEIASLDGRLDVTFTPAHRHAVRQQFGLFAVDYFMMYGTYRGVIRGSDRSFDLDGVHGVCERMHARL